MTEPLPEPGGATAPDPIDAFMREVAEAVDTMGWIVQGVFGTQENPGTSFAYTVGLTLFGYPELCMSGLNLDTMRTILNDLTRPVYDKARRYSHGETVEGILGNGLKLTIVNGLADKDGIWPGTAYALYGSERVRLQQAVWPDRNRLMPWEDGCLLKDEHQQLIGVPPGVKAR